MEQGKSITQWIAIAALGVLCGAGAVVGYRILVSQAQNPAPVAVAAVGVPLRLIIPSINVDAPVRPVGIDAKGNIGVPPDAVQVAWYKYGPRPGMPGAAVIDGHLDTKYVPQAVFYNLDKLQPGDEVDVRTDGNKTITFKVAAVKTVPYDASSTDIFISKSGEGGLYLITCAGDWLPSRKLYNERLVVFAKLE